MPHKSRIIFSLLSCLLLISGYAGNARAEHKLRMGTFIIDPMVTRDSEGKYHGAVVEVAEHIAGLEGWELEIVQCDFHECLSMLESGELDLTSPIGFTEERSRRIDYIEETLLMDWGQIYAARELNISSILDLHGKRVVTMTKSIFNKPFTDLLDSFDVIVDMIHVSEYLDVFRYVQDGRADAMILNRTFGEKNITGFGQVEKTPIVFKPIDIRFATPKGKHKDIRESLDSRLRELKADPFSEYYVSVDRMFGAKAPGFHIPQWVEWIVFGGGGLVVLLFILSIVLRHQVNLRTRELRHENEERRQAERNLFESRESFKTLVEFTAAIHWELDLISRRFIYVSPQAVSMLGYPLDAWIDLEFWKRILHPEDRDWAYEHCMEESRKGNDHEFVYRAIDSGGQTVWLRDIVKVIKDESGPEKLIGIMFDITEQKLAEEKIEASLEEKKVLLKEIHHRVKNNMAIISSLNSLQSMNVNDEEAIRILKDGRNRIRAMALVHEQLYLSEDMSDINVKAYLTGLVNNVLNSYADSKNANVKVESGNLRLSIDLLVPCGIIINELLTNALKYAYGSAGAGEVIVSLKPSEGKVCSLTVSDRGRGLPPDFNLEEAGTLGLQLVKSLVHQLEGEMNISNNAGLSVEIVFCSEECR